MFFFFLIYSKLTYMKSQNENDSPIKYSLRGGDLCYFTFHCMRLFWDEHLSRFIKRELFVKQTHWFLPVLSWELKFKQYDAKCWWLSGMCNICACCAPCIVSVLRETMLLKMVDWLVCCLSACPHLWEEDAVEVFHYYGLHLSSSFLM